MTSEAEFQDLVAPHRRELHAHCYRMLGSLQDTEDALQEALLRAWRGLDHFDRSRPIKPWLYRIATNVCIDIAARRPQRVLAVDPTAPETETLWLEPYPDAELSYEQREGVELAFVAALQHLPARQRAVLILREVLGFSAREVAQSLDTTAASVNSALQRARATIEERLPQRTQQQQMRALGDAEMRNVVARYVEAWETRDVDRMLAVLVEDATFAMPPHPIWRHGRDAVVGFISGTGKPALRHVPTTSNGQPAIGWYIQWEAGRPYEAASLEVLALEGNRVRDITAFASPELFGAFGLPAEVAS